jgi:hypothetical protein
MSKLSKFYVREVRDRLGRYPNWPLGQAISLGRIGYYDGRNAEFDWQKSLTDFGLAVAPANGAAAPVEELYSSEDSVRLSFVADGGTGSKAQFTFTRKRSLAFQGYQMSITELDLGDLLSKLRTLVAGNPNAWDSEYVIITTLWVGQSFTTLISGERKSDIAISASAPPPPPGSPFNIANPSFGLGVSSSNGMSYKVVAEQRPGSQVFPFFHVHKLVNHDQKGLVLKRYGDDSGWFWG